MSAGYIYAVMDSATDGRITIKKTNQDPTELFPENEKNSLLYREYFEDSIEGAEQRIHDLLHKSRQTEYSNVFQVAPYEAIECIQRVKMEPLPQLANPTKEIPVAAYDLFDNACNYYYGRGQIPQDYEKAKEFFHEASQQGVLPAFVYLGRMFEYGDGVQQDAEKALEFYKMGAKRGSNLCHAKIGCLLWRDTKVKNLETGKKHWNNYFTQLDHTLITKDDYSNFNFYITLAKENQLDIHFEDILAMYKTQMLQLLNIRKDVVVEQHAHNLPFKKYMVSLIDEEMEFVHSLITKETPDLPENYAICTDYITIPNMGIIILADVERGSFHVGDSINLRSPSGTSHQTVITKIDRYGEFTSSTKEGENVGFLIHADEKKVKFVKGDATITTKTPLIKGV
ncbi:hypothetical protein ACERII_12990 [Evansella sp. AB-rgal1]|uniref:hypothetical protein n=1 Tax=Evansella sp. AB-rgal1 TaxID=3242696 RepID=UPI00359EC1DD